MTIWLLRTHVRQAVSGLSLLYLISLCLPVLYENGHWTLWGCQCLLLFPIVMMFPSWWANPLFAVGLYFLGKGQRRVAFWCGCIALTLALGFMCVFYRATSFPFGPGYFAWVICMLGLVLSAKFLSPELAEPPSPPLS
jgi:hypothetical protein